MYSILVNTKVMFKNKITTPESIIRGGVLEGCVGLTNIGWTFTGFIRIYFFTNLMILEIRFTI